MPFHGRAIKLAHVEEALEGLGRQCANQTDPQPTAIRTELESKPQRTDAVTEARSRNQQKEGWSSTHDELGCSRTQRHLREHRTSSKSSVLLRRTFPQWTNP